jgi:bacteriocin-like protein
MKKFGNLGKNEMSKSEMKQVNGGKWQYCYMPTQCGEYLCRDGSTFDTTCGTRYNCDCSNQLPVDPNA